MCPRSGLGGISLLAIGRAGKVGSPRDGIPVYGMGTVEQRRPERGIDLQRLQLGPCLRKRPSDRGGLAADELGLSHQAAEPREGAHHVGMIAEILAIREPELSHVIRAITEGRREGPVRDIHQRVERVAPFPVQLGLGRLEHPRPRRVRVLPGRPLALDIALEQRPRLRIRQSCGVHPRAHLGFHVLVPRHPLGPGDVRKLVGIRTLGPPQRVIEAVALRGVRVGAWREKTALMLGSPQTGTGRPLRTDARRCLDRPMGFLDRFLALLQRIFYPLTDTPEQALQAMRNGTVGSWIMVAMHFLLGAVILIQLSGDPRVTSGDMLIPATIQLFFALIYAGLATASWKGSRAAAVGILVFVLFDMLVVTTRVSGFDLQATVQLIPLILAIGGVRGTFAYGRFVKSGEA